ncbi:ribbon-helix-helix protein, CopG family [Tepidimicrobium xylanilyticum]
MEKKKKVKFTTNIDEELLKKIKIKAIDEGKNVNEIIEKLLREYLKR